MKVFKVLSGHIIAIPPGAKFVKIIRGYRNGALLIGVSEAGDTIEDVARKKPKRSHLIDDWDADKHAPRLESRSA